MYEGTMSGRGSCAREEKSTVVLARVDSAAAATRLFRGDESRRRRGCDVDIPWRRVTPRLGRGSSVETESRRRPRTDVETAARLRYHDGVREDLSQAQLLYLGSHAEWRVQVRALQSKVVARRTAKGSFRRFAKASLAPKAEAVAAAAAALAAGQPEHASRGAGTRWCLQDASGRIAATPRGATRLFRGDGSRQPPRVPRG